MKVLWVCNQPLNGARNSSGSIMTYGGGWLNEEARALIGEGDIEIIACFADRNAKSLIKTRDGKITHYAVPRRIHNLFKYDRSMEKFFDEIVETEKPDFCHIHGTENANALSLIRRHSEFTYVVSLQGIISYICLHEKAGVPAKYRKNRTVFSMIARNGTDSLAKKHAKYANIEHEILASADYFLGRTEWDKACSFLNNQSARYVNNPRLLRPPFYDNSWSVESCERHTIFVSQSSTALKGTHFVLMALNEIKKQYPDAKLIIAGKPLNTGKYLQNLIKGNAYQQYLLHLIRKYGLIDSVSFTGELDAEGMVEQLKHTHVFVSSSSIDNSPNSLGEAMMIGVPCVASFVGGVPDMLVHKKEGFLYPYDEYYILAYDVCRIFADDNLARSLSENAQKHARTTHDRANSRFVINLYRDVYNGDVLNE